MGIEEEVSELVEEAVEEATEKVAEEAGEAVEEVGELADSLTETHDEASNPVEDVNEALDMAEKFRTIAQEEAYRAIDDHQKCWPHGETVHVHHDNPAPEKDDDELEISPLEALVSDALPEATIEEEDDEPETKEHGWFRSFGGKK